MARTQSLNPDRAWGEIEIFVLDDEGMAAVNAAVFRKAGPTDTISQAYAPAPGPDGFWRADLFVNAECAQREGCRRPGGSARELALYTAHACHHLADCDDAAPADRRRMRRVETAWLRTAERQGLIAGLIMRRGDQ